MAGIFESIPLISVILFAVGLVGVMVYERARSRERHEREMRDGEGEQPQQPEPERRAKRKEKKGTAPPS